MESAEITYRLGVSEATSLVHSVSYVREFRVEFTLRQLEIASGVRRWQDVQYRSTITVDYWRRQHLV